MYTSTPEIYTLSLHDALPISVKSRHAAPLDPLARRSGAHNRQARIDWRTLESRLAQAEHGCLARKPLLAVVAIDRGSVGAVRCRWSVFGRTVRIIRHVGQVKRASIVWRVTSASPIGWIGVGQTRIVSAELAVGVGDRAEPFGCRTPEKTKLHAVIVSHGRLNGWALGAERS